MSKTSGFYSIVTDGNSIFVSNTSKNSVCKISSDGKVDNQFIIVTQPISIAIRPNVFFVQTLRLIHVYDISVPYQATTLGSFRYDSSAMYPSMVYNPYDNLLYISNYEKGTITTMNSFGIFTQIINGVVGISGMCISSKLLYFSNEKRDTLSFYTNNIINESLSISNPKGICSSPNGIYICYHTSDKHGIALHKPDTSIYTDVLGVYLNRTMPLTVAFSGGDIYYTCDERSEIYKNEERYKVIEYVDIQITTGITKSVVITNPNCLNNPAFTGLINLRTVGSNPNNPIIPVTTLVGRTQGTGVKIDAGIGMSYDILKMRRKAEILKYKNVDSHPGSNLTKKQILSNVVNAGGSYQYSKAKLEKLLREQNCKVGLNKGVPIEKTPPTNSGIIDPTFEGYYLNTYIPYYSSL